VLQYSVDHHPKTHVARQEMCSFTQHFHTL